MEPNSSIKGLKFFFVEVITVGIIGCLAIFVLNYFGIISLSSLSPSFFLHPQEKKSQNFAIFTPTTSPTQPATLPLPLDNPNVVSIAYLYKLKGTIETVETVNNNLVITLKQTKSALPPLNILNNTSVFIIDAQGNTQKVTRESLQANQQISLSAVYDPSSNKWSGYDIRIFENSSP